MKQMSLRLRLMIIMICLTTLPVATVTWIATINTRESVEKELISANESRIVWAGRYLNELIDQIDSIFYTLQNNRELTSKLDNQDTGSQSQTHDTLRDTLTSVFFTNARKIDRLTLYSDLSKNSLSVSYADSGTMRQLDIQESAWRRISKEPIRMYFKQTAKGIDAYHSINRFPDKYFLGGISVGINDDVWKEVAQILKSESDSYVFNANGFSPKVALLKYTIP
jgi:two-component system, sensor histidine kinase YesM